MTLSPEAAVQKLVGYLLKSSDLSTAQALANAAAALDSDAEVAILSGIFQAVSTNKGPSIINGLWAVWERSRQAEIERWLHELNFPATSPLNLVALSVCKLGLIDSTDPWWTAPDGGVDWIEPLLYLCADPDLLVQQRANQILLSLPVNAARAREEVCRWVIEHNHADATSIALKAGYTPAQLERRALFFLLTGKWNDYEALDFDRRIFKTILETADDNLRQQIAEKARQSGWRGFVEVVAIERQQRRLSDLSDPEWEVVIMLLNQENRSNDLWRLAQAAPAHWSARLLRNLHEIHWIPPSETEKDQFHRLSQAAIQALHSGSPKKYLTRPHTALSGHQRKITALQFSNEYLISASADKTIRVWDCAGGNQLRILEGHSDFVLSISASQAHGLLASGGTDRTVRIWRLRDGELLHTLGGHQNEIFWSGFLGGETILATADAGKINIWSAREGQLIRSLRGHFDQLVSVGISPDGSTIITLDHQKSLRLFDLNSGELRKTLLEPIVGWSASPNGHLGTSSSYGTVRIWDLATAEQDISLPGRATTQLLVFDSHSRWLAGAARKEAYLWKIQDGTSEKNPELIKLSGHQLLITALAINPESSLLATGSEDRTIRLWQLPHQGQPELAAILEDHTTPITNLLFTQNGFLASADDRIIRLWALDDLDKLLRSVPGEVTQAELRLWEQHLASFEASSPEQTWVSFTLEMARWHRRFDIDLQEAGRTMIAGNFDIEIEIFHTQA